MPLTVGQNRTNAFHIATDYATFMGGGLKPDLMTTPGQQVFMPSVIDKEGVTTALGITTKEEDSWAVLRAFFARAEETDVIRAVIEVWEVDYIGENPSTNLAELKRRPCPICDRSAFWMELAGEEFRGERAPTSGRCYRAECGAWVEQNSVEVERTDCGWPSAQWTKKCESFNMGIRGLVEMRGAVDAAGKPRRARMDKEMMRDL